MSQSERFIRTLLAMFVLCASTVTALAQDPVRLALGDDATTQTVRRLLGVPEGKELRVRTGREVPLIRYQVSFESFDGLTINADYAHASENPNAPTLILLPNMRSSRRDFAQLEDFLLQRGYSYLAFDLRGYGGSRFMNDGTAIDTDAMENDIEGTEFRKMARDVEAAIDWLYARHLVRSGGIFLVGDRVGGTAAAMGLVENATDVRGAVIFNPVRSFRSINADELLGKIQGRPVLLVAASVDRAATTSIRFIQSANSAARAEILHDIDPRVPLSDSRRAQEVILEFIESLH
ncbi:MAG: uncharacterized protein PWP23_3133 [Candidatus Sumerlaeota bacterium]|nr:uncharacterized protein [Candidatus Sumerlaeota bacterium]